MTAPFHGKAPWGLLFLAFFLGSLMTYSWIFGKTPFPLPAACMSNAKTHPTCNYVINRVKGFEYTQPLLSAEPLCESTAFATFKPNLLAAVDSLKRAGAITNASIYLREFKYGEWLVINPEIHFHPASLMKVALLLTYLRQAEAIQGLLTQRLRFTPPPDQLINPQFYSFPTIEAGKEYTVHELLYFMIANSDNNATWLLASRLDMSHIKKMFFDLGLPEPAQDDLKFTMTAEEISVFFKALFNASYLSPEYSDYAARLLSNCAFQNGFVQGLPADTKMWHKFGEWRSEGQDSELHESGVIYIGETPYLLTVMTRGTDTDKLAGSIRVLARAVYDRLVSGEVLDK